MSFVADEWATFWNFVQSNTGQHSMGPLRTLIRGEDTKKQDERAMLFFLTYKDYILYRTPRCNCGSKTYHEHKKDCDVGKFHVTALNFK